MEELAVLILIYRAECEAAYAGGPAPRCDLLYAVLAREIARMARGVSHAGRSQTRVDFVEAAPGLIFGCICSYEPSKGPLAPWLWTVTRNAWRDWCRPLRPSAELSTDPAERELTDYSEMLSVPLSARDLAAMETLGIRNRIVLCCLAGLWVVIAEKRWKDWLAEYEHDSNQSIPRPFPPESFRGLEEPRDRLPALAAALGTNRNVLAVMWSAQRWRLGVVPRLRDFYYRGPEDGPGPT